MLYSIGSLPPSGLSGQRDGQAPGNGNEEVVTHSLGPFSEKSQRKAAKPQRGEPQPKDLNRRKQRKQRRENFAENAQFSEIALQRFQDL
jgi:hypothetical protein